MKAKEMFEKLGYEQRIKDDVIYYSKYINIPRRYGYSVNFNINFLLYHKEIFASQNITCKELQAINKQVEELGWLGSDKE